MSQQDSNSESDFTIVPNKAGTFSLKQVSSGEIMHSVSDPLQEARRLYAGQVDWAVLSGTQGQPLVIWDVGLGGAGNVAALAEVVPNGLHAIVVSFETALEGLRLALGSPDKFPYLESLPAQGLLENGYVADAPWGEWVLASDVFQSPAHVPPPAIIFYDMFSVNHRPDHWGTEAFKYLRQKSEPRTQLGGTLLITHSRSTSVRAAMMLAGWQVGLGVASGPKPDTTLARTPGFLDCSLIEPFRPLDQRWFQRWERSQQPLPGDFAGTREEARSIILNKIQIS